MAWNEPYVHREIVEVTTPRDTINLPKRYHPGQGDIMVFLNGVYLTLGKEYTESSPWSIKFNGMLETGDSVTVHYQKLW